MTKNDKLGILDLIGEYEFGAYVHLKNGKWEPNSFYKHNGESMQFVKLDVDECSGELFLIYRNSKRKKCTYFFTRINRNGALVTDCDAKFINAIYKRIDYETLEYIADRYNVKI